MREALLEAATVISNSSVREWKADGKKVVGYTCSYVPDEIFHAAGILPYRMRGVGAEETTIGDTYFGPFICSLPKCMLQLIGQGAFDFLDGAIVTPGCDSMRRLDDCWRKAGEDYQGIVPGFFFHFGVPHKYTDYTVKWFTEEIRRLIDAIERYFDLRITKEGLKRSISVYNRGRELLQESDRLRIMEEPPFNGTDAHTVILAGSALPRDAYNEMLQEFLEESRSSAPGIGGKTRLMLVGSANDDVQLVRVIEGDRALVVADNLCFGSRFHHDLVSEEGDPIHALAKRYLSMNECPRMYGEYQARLSMVKDTIRRAGVDGVILQNIRFCDLHGAENGLFERDLEAMGIPCIRIEREYGPLVETGRLKMRIDAFLERIAQIKEIA